MLSSYAQNFEDVVLWRALRHVEHGFYIDIGAQDPVIDSVSLGFYEKGWRGVHVEPTPAYAAKLRAARADEDVIEAAIAQSPGPITLFEIADTGLSTGKTEIAGLHEKSGLAPKSIEVSTLALSELFARYANCEIHWLKIDVEGMEDEVIATWLPSATRPWIVLVESTVPRSQQPDYVAWEPGLLSLGYEFVYFDGLNRFYVHCDRAQLRSAFGVGPNVFDDFTLGQHSQFTSKLTSEIARLRNEAQSHLAETARLTDRIGRISSIAATEREALIEQLTALEKREREKDIEIGQLHYQIAETSKAHSTERAALIEHLNILEQQHQEKVAEIDRLNGQLAEASEVHATERDALTKRVSIIEQLLVAAEKAYAAERLLLVERASNAEQQAILFEQAIRSSTSWRVTAPARGLKRGAESLAAWPRTAARLGFRHAVAWLRYRPRARALAKSLVRSFPALERRLQSYFKAQSVSRGGVDPWTLEPDRDFLAEWRKLFQ